MKFEEKLLGAEKIIDEMKKEIIHGCTIGDNSIWIIRKNIGLPVNISSR